MRCRAGPAPGPKQWDGRWTRVLQVRAEPWTPGMLRSRIRLRLMFDSVRHSKSRCWKTPLRSLRLCAPTVVQKAKDGLKPILTTHSRMITRSLCSRGATNAMNISDEDDLFALSD
jgi:hypothetical protein